MSATDEAAQAAMDAFPSFAARLEPAWRRTHPQLDVLQVNIGRLCNLACRHCHMDAGPHRTEVMSKETAEHCLEVCTTRGFTTLDITGGAPEMCPSFEWMIREAAAHDIHTIVRSNLVILHEPEYAHLPELFADLGVEIFASLPHYTAKQAEKQRGSGTFDKVITMMRRLNELGYGTQEEADDLASSNKKLVLNLVFNPSGALLPPDQVALEREYREKLAKDFGISFNNLFAIANNPLGRFGNRLQQTGNLTRYMTKLIDAYNPEAAENMMCRSQLSVGWDGALYDCDFNQAAQLPCVNRLTIADMAVNPALPLERAIAFGNHCYACTAGAGSS